MYREGNLWYWQIVNIENSSSQKRFQVYDQVSLLSLSGVTSIMRLIIQDIKPHCIFLFLGKLDKAGSQKSLL